MIRMLILLLAACDALSAQSSNNYAFHLDNGARVLYQIFSYPPNQQSALSTASTSGNVIQRIMRDEKRAANLEVLEDLCNTMKFGSLCALGGFTPYPVMSALIHFPEDFGAQPRLQAAE